MNNLFMKITSYVIILALFLYFVFVQPSFNVLAASVSSLPKDLDISVDFDSDNIYVSYNGYDTTISRHTPTTFDNGYHYVYYSGTVYACKDYFAFGYFPPSAYNASVRYTYLPSELEKCNGKVANASYWLDPVSNCVYVFTSSFSGYYGMYSGITRMIDNYFVFPFSQSKTWPWIVTVTRIDLVTNVVTHYFDYAYSTTDGTKNGIFTLNTLYTFDYHGNINSRIIVHIWRILTIPHNVRRHLTRFNNVYLKSLHRTISIFIPCDYFTVIFSHFVKRQDINHILFAIGCRNIIGESVCNF